MKKIMLWLIQIYQNIFHRSKERAHAGFTLHVPNMRMKP